MVRMRTAAAALAALLASPLQAATLDQWGSVAATGSYACFHATCNLIDFVGDFFDPGMPPTRPGLAVNPPDGGSQVNSAYDEIAPGADPNGTARAQVTQLGPLAVPELKAEAFSNGGGGVAALAVGVQGYTYLGGSGTVTFSLGLTGAINDTDAPPAPFTAQEQQTIDFLTAFDPTFDPNAIPDLTRLEVLGALFAVDSGFSLDTLTALSPLGALDALYQYTDIDSVTIVEDFDNDGIANLGNEISVTGLAAGDTFYLFTALLASADGAGQYADAFSTLSVEVTTGAAEIAAVPLPGAAWLLAPAVLVLAGRRRTLPAA